MNYRSICFDDCYTAAFAELVKAEAIQSSERGRTLWKRLAGFECPITKFRHPPLRSNPDSLQRSALGAMVVFDRVGFDLAAIHRTLFGSYPNDDSMDELEEVVIHGNASLQSLIAKGEIFQTDAIPERPGRDSLPWFPSQVTFPNAEELQKALPTIDEHRDFFMDVLLARSVFHNGRECERFFKLLRGVAHHDDLPFLGGQLAYDQVRIVLQPLISSMRTAVRRDVPVFARTPLTSLSETKQKDIHDHVYQLIRLQLEGSLNLPEPRSIAQAIELRNNPAVLNLREGLHRWTESLLKGSRTEEARARKELIGFSQSLRSLQDCSRGGRLLTYVSIPITIADMFLSGGAAAGLIATAAGLAVQGIADYKQREIRQQIFSFRPQRIDTR